MNTYLLAGGGTAGHVNPLLALADYIRQCEPQAKIVVLGTAAGLEARLVPARGFELVTIPKLPFPRRPNAYALRFPAAYRRAVQRVRELIREREITAVIGFGGYAAAPAYQAAWRERIPCIIHEANAKPGLANLLGARTTPYVAVTFPGTPIRHATVTGMPLRAEIATLRLAERRLEAREFFGLDPHKQTLLVTGGSLGARAINQAVVASAAEIIASGVQVLHIWGGLTKIADPQLAGYRVLAYCDRMELAFAAADLVLARAGSTTVSELSGLGLPAVFVPLGHGNGEQRRNAAAMVAAGGALILDERELNARWFAKTLLPLLQNPARLTQMGKASASVGTLAGAAELYKLLGRALAARHEN